MDIRDIKRARENLKGVIHKTGLDLSTTFSGMAGAQVYLKSENLQKTGSFKIRGAYNKMVGLDTNSRSKGVIAASAGNHAQGVAFAAHSAGINSLIVMPETAPFSKVAATRGYGAQVLLHGRVYDEACEKAQEIQQSSGAVFIHAFDDLEVIAGQGTIGLEIMEELPDVDLIFVPVGGGGLASGVALAAKSINPQAKVIGVEAKGAACLKASREKGSLCPLTSIHTIADGIAVKCPGELTYNLLNKYMDDVVVVDDEEIASTILLLLERAKMIVEGAGAVSLAAVLYNKYPVSGKKIAVIISGGNIDVNFISLIIEKGLVKAGRHIRLVTSLPDIPGSLQAFLEIVARERGNVISINHDRTQLQLPIDRACIEAVVETQGREHGERIIKVLKDSGFNVEAAMLKFGASDKPS